MTDTQDLPVPTMAKVEHCYKQLPSGVIVRDETTFIPDDNENGDWKAYLDWCADGGVADPVLVSEPEPVDTELVALQQSARDKIATNVGLTPDETVALFGIAQPTT